MAKFRLKMPVKTADFRDYLMRLQHELSLIRSAYRAAGVTTAQGQMLCEIESAEPINIVSLTQLLGLDKSTVSQTLAQLQRLGWVDLKENAADRRYKIVLLTASGRERVTMLQQSFDTQLELLLKDATEQERNGIAFGIGYFAQLLEDQRQSTSTQDEEATSQAASTASSSDIKLRDSSI